MLVIESFTEMRYFIIDILLLRFYSIFNRTIVSDPLIVPLASFQQLKESSVDVCMNAQWYSKQQNTYYPISSPRDRSIVPVIT